MRISRLIMVLEIPSKLSGNISAILVLPLIGVLIIEVFARYIFGSPTKWVFDITYMLMGSIFMLGISYALQNKQHVCVDVVYQNLPNKAKTLIDTILYVIFLPIVLYMTYFILLNVHRSYLTGEVSGVSAWNPIVWPFRLIWFIGFLIFSIQIVSEIMISIRNYTIYKKSNGNK